MATAKDIASAVSNGGAELAATGKANTLASLLKVPNIKQRFEEMLGKKAAGFMSSMLSVTNQNKLLQKANPMTIISAAAIAASLDLPINPSLGFAYIIPYGDVAQFQMGWRGLVQLAMRSGQYKTMNVAEVYDGELCKHNRITGEMEFINLEEGAQKKIVGYVAYFKLINGFEKYLYMTVEQATAHGRRYSKSFSNGQWSKDFDAMAKKTVLKMLLSKFGILSVDMQKAIETDQGVIKDVDGNKVEYPDNPIDVETGEVSMTEEEKKKDEDLMNSFGDKK